MKLLSRFKSAVCNLFYYKCVLLVFLIPTLLAPAVSFNYKLLFVMLGWGAVLCVYDLFTKRIFLRAPGMLWLLAFLIVFLITVFLNIKNNFSGNLTVFGYTVIALILLYPDHTGGDKVRVVKEMYVLNNIFISMTAILSTISLCMFVSKYSEIMTFDGRKFIIGWYANRLYGMYKNMGYMTSAIGLALIVIQCTVMKARQSKIGKLYKIFLVYTAAVNFLSMCMENAKGAFISLAVFVAFFVFLFALRRLKRRNASGFRTVATTVTVTLVSVALFFGSIYCLRPLLAYVPSVYETITSETVLDDDNNIFDDIVQEDIDREIPENYGSFTGRPKIWKFGIEQFLQKPLFGYGANSHSGYKIVDGELSHFHNLIIQSLVSVGLIGSVFIAIFFVKRFVISFITIWKRISDADQYLPVSIAIFSLLAMFLMNSMAEVTVLFQARFSMFLFWMMLGYMTTLLDYEKRKEDTLLEQAANVIDARLMKARKNAK